jgi:clan AA aspartic protease (TIGR02281 family)
MVSTFKTTKRAACVLTIAVLLTGGTAVAQTAERETAAERQWHAIVSNNEAMKLNWHDCMLNVYKSPDFIPLYPRLAEKSSENNNKLPTDHEISLMSQMHRKTKSCRQSVFDGYSRLSPTMVPIFAAAGKAIDDTYLDFFLKKQTWEEFNRRIHDLIATSDREMDREMERIFDGLQQAHRAELAERQAKDEIQLQRRGGGTFVLPVTINNSIVLQCMLDSGASDVQLPAEVIRKLFRIGALSDYDFLGIAQYSLADGSDYFARLFHIREIKVGKHIVRDITVNEGPPGSDALLGQSFLSKLPSWTLDNKRHVLILAR